MWTLQMESNLLSIPWNIVVMIYNVLTDNALSPFPVELQYQRGSIDYEIFRGLLHWSFQVIHCLGYTGNTLLFDFDKKRLISIAGAATLSQLTEQGVISTNPIPDNITTMAAANQSIESITIAGDTTVNQAEVGGDTAVSLSGLQIDQSTLDSLLNTGAGTVPTSQPGIKLIKLLHVKSQKTQMGISCN